MIGIEEPSSTAGSWQWPTALVRTIVPKGKNTLLTKVTAGMSPLQGSVADPGSNSFYLILDSTAVF